MAWTKRFFDPIPAPGGELVTLLEAGNYVAALPAAKQKLTHWQDAAEALMLVVKFRGDPMLARIAMMQAINYGKPAEPRRRHAKTFRIVRSER